MLLASSWAKSFIGKASKSDVTMKISVCALLVLSVFMAGCEPSKPPPVVTAISSAQAAQIAREKQEAEEARVLGDCRANAASQTAEYRKLMASKDFWAASGKLRRCSQVLDDPKLKALVADAEIKSSVRDVENTKAPAAERVRAYERLERDYPEQAKRFAKTAATLRQQAASEQVERRLATRFDRTPPLGASQSDVINSGWGYPRDTNKTTTSAGVREQWVYGPGKYLYFQNGVLTAIQE